MKTTTDTISVPKHSLLINRNFGLLWIGQAVSDLGDMIYLVTLSLWIAVIIAKNQPWAPTAVSGVMIAMALPSLLLGLVFETYDTIYLGAGLLFLLGAFYTIANLHDGTSAS